jgi:hypothetical protein
MCSLMGIWWHKFRHTVPGPLKKGSGLHINNSLRPLIVPDCAIPTLCPSASLKSTCGCSRPMY